MFISNYVWRTAMFDRLKPMTVGQERAVNVLRDPENELVGLVRAHGHREVAS
jgi:hypothetical protein